VFVEGVEAAVAGARSAAGERWVSLGGAPLLLTSIRVADAPNVTHLRYRVEKTGG